MTTNIIQMPKRLDYTFGNQFYSALNLALEKNPEVSLDCSVLEYIDSAGIGLLVMANKKAQSQNAKLVMFNLNAAPKEILQLANLQKLIEIR